MDGYCLLCNFTASYNKLDNLNRSCDYIGEITPNCKFKLDQGIIDMNYN